MKALNFLESIGFYAGNEEKIWSAFQKLFGRTLDRYTFSDSEKLAIITKAFVKMKKERDVTLAALRREIKMNDELRQVEFVFRQKTVEVENPETL